MALFDEIPGGGVVSEITPLANDPNLRRVRVGRKIVATLRAADIESLKLKVGTEWTASLAARIEHAQAVNKARKDAMRLLGRRAFSSAEIVERLAAKGHDRAVAVQVSEELVKAGWIDEAKLAEALVHQTTRSKPAGRNLLKEKLKARKITAPVIRQSLAEHGTMNQETSAALDFARTRLRTITALPNATILRRIAGLLARRGFDDDIIDLVLDQLQLRPPECD